MRVIGIRSRRILLLSLLDYILSMFSLVRRGLCIERWSSFASAFSFTGLILIVEIPFLILRVGCSYSHLSMTFLPGC